MNTVTLRNNSHFPDYELSPSLLETCGAELLRSNKRTGDEVITVWDNTSDEELVMLWLWHNGEVREIYRLAPKTITQASLLEGMGVAVISEVRERCLYKPGHHPRLRPRNASALSVVQPDLAVTLSQYASTGHHGVQLPRDTSRGRYFKPQSGAKTTRSLSM